MLVLISSSQPREGLRTLRSFFLDMLFMGKSSLPQSLIYLPASKPETHLEWLPLE